MSRIVILGSGAWGTALALAFHRRGGHQIALWSYSGHEAAQINAARENILFLPGFPLPADIGVTSDDESVANAEIVLSVIPSEFLRPTLSRLRPAFHPGQIVVSATKGVENNTFLRMTEVIAATLASEESASIVSEEGARLFSERGASFITEGGGGFNPRIRPIETARALAPEEAVGRDRAVGRDFSPGNIPAVTTGALAPEASSSKATNTPNPDTHLEVFTEAAAPEVSSSGIAPAPVPLEELSLPSQPIPIGAFSGPSFALEVAQGQPTAITVAFEDASIAARIQSEFSSETLRLYTSTDVIGVELGGALKNVIAIAAGVAAGMGLGHNSAAALMTRGIAEITRLAVACGGRRETLAGLSGVGDLVLTCTGSLSRNRTVGQALGQGQKLPEILEGLGGKVAEGVLTTRAALGLARRHNIEMPITEQMELILEKGKDPREAIKDLMLRPGKHEH